MNNFCLNPKCGASITTEGIPAFGWGKMDLDGYWEFPCEICAREWEYRNPHKVAWPKVKSKEQTQTFRAMSLQAKRSIHEATTTAKNDKYHIAVEAILYHITSWNEIRHAWLKLEDNKKIEIKSVWLDILREVL